MIIEERNYGPSKREKNHQYSRKNDFFAIRARPGQASPGQPRPGRQNEIKKLKMRKKIAQPSKPPRPAGQPAGGGGQDASPESACQPGKPWHLWSLTGYRTIPMHFHLVCVQWIPWFLTLIFSSWIRIKRHTVQKRYPKAGVSASRGGPPKTWNRELSIPTIDRSILSFSGNSGPEKIYAIFIFFKSPRLDSH